VRGIFPEGTRNLTGDVEGKGGAALLGALSGAPVVPAAISEPVTHGRFTGSGRVRRADPGRAEKESGRGRSGEVDR